MKEKYLVNQKSVKDYTEPMPRARDYTVHIIEEEDGELYEYYFYVKKTRVNKSEERIKELKRLGYVPTNKRPTYLEAIELIKF